MGTKEQCTGARAAAVVKTRIEICVIFCHMSQHLINPRNS